MIEIKDIGVSTSERIQIIDITDEVEKYISEKKVRSGIVVISTKHTTSAIRINEAEPRLLRDMKNFLCELVDGDKNYLHDDIERRLDCPSSEPKNADSHLRALLLGASETISIKNGKLNLGKWQRIFFIELDGPRRREFSLVLVVE